MTPRASGGFRSESHPPTNVETPFLCLTLNIDTTMGPEPTALERTNQETFQLCDRFRIASVGRSGAGKSSLINHIFQVNDAKVSHHEPGEANIYSEFTSETNPRFILHDSKGFEPADATTFNIVRDFIKNKSDKSLKLQDQLHALLLCIKTPIAGGRVVESGDEELLKLAHQLRIPVIVVFTQYDKLIRGHMVTNEKIMKDPKELRQWGETQAAQDFEKCVDSLKGAAIRLKLDTTPSYINVSGESSFALCMRRPDLAQVTQTYTDNISPLVTTARKLVEDDLWATWARAQQVDLPLKIELCVAKGMDYYWRALAGGIPLVGDALLRETLVRVHEEIVACWNFKDMKSVLTCEEFKHLMVYVVQDMKGNNYRKSSPVEIDKINQFVTLCTAATASFAPPAAVLGLTFLFVKWLSDAALENAVDVQRVLIAYIVDLILVMEELFQIALQPKVFGRVSWEALQEALHAYVLTASPRSTHDRVHALVEQRGGLNPDVYLIRKAVEELVQQYR
ncbi:hypothetical protein B0H14DRAFT_3712156 [Mycena olivaceomarginata]|nr:hypothetical protein B0H14DRAFT_3712156 [Mycena olivaceomarginata]